MQLDVQNSLQVEKALEGLDIDILVNNAGLALSSDKMQEADSANWDTMIDTNLKGLLYITRVCLKKMVQKNSGHIVNVGSIAGRGCYIGGNVYCATKHAVRAISQSLRLDLLGTKIRVSEVAPGAVETEFSEVRWHDKEKSKKFYEGFQALQAEDIADCILYCVTRKEHVNVSEIVVYPRDQASFTDIQKS